MPALGFTPCHGEGPRRGAHAAPPAPALLPALDARRTSNQRASSSGRPALCPPVRPTRAPTCGSAAAGLAGATAESAGANGSAAPTKKKQFDVVALSNLCVDIVVPVEELPPADTQARQQLLVQLTASPPSMDSWEVGGQTNLLIAASRMGLKAASVGHVGQDIYGQFLAQVLEVRPALMLRFVGTPAKVWNQCMSTWNHIRP